MLLPLLLLLLAVGQQQLVLLSLLLLLADRTARRVLVDGNLPTCTLCQVDPLLLATTYVLAANLIGIATPESRRKAKPRCC